MQFAKFLSLAAVAAPLVSAHSSKAFSRRDDGIKISYAEDYLNITKGPADFGCGTAAKDNRLKNYAKFVDVLADYTAVIATPWAADDKKACGECVNITYVENGMSRTVFALTVDSTGGFFNLDKAGFSGLNGYGGFAKGSLTGSANTVDHAYCKRAHA